IGLFVLFQKVDKVCPKNKRHTTGYPLRTELPFYILMICHSKAEQTKLGIMWEAAMYHRKPHCDLFFSIGQDLNLTWIKNYLTELRSVQAIRYQEPIGTRPGQATVAQETLYYIR